MRVLQRLALLTTLAVVSMSANCPRIDVQPPSIDVEARVHGVDGAGRPTPDFIQAMRHDGAGSAPRLVYASNVSVMDVQNLRLTAVASTGLPFQEEWHLLHVTHTSQRPGDDPVFLEFTRDRGWLNAHLGNLAWLTMRKNDVHLPSEFFSRFPPSSLRRGGSFILARVEDDDPFLPWVNSSGCTARANVPFAISLRPPSPTGIDCFDMQTLASVVLNQFAVIVTNAALDNSARVVRHRLAVIPHIPTVPAPPTPTVSSTPPLPGFGFIYTADLEPMIAGIPAGSFTGTLSISVPLTVSFLRFGADGFFIGVDPLTLTAGTRQVNDERITVQATDGTIAAGLAESVRGSVVAAVTTATLPSGPGGISFTSFLELLFAETLMDHRGVPVDFSILAIPDDRTVPGAPLNVALSQPAIPVTEGPVSPPLPGGLGARTVTTTPSGAVLVTLNMNPAGSVARVFTIQTPREELPFRLLLLR